MTIKQCLPDDQEPNADGETKTHELQPSIPGRWLGQSLYTISLLQQRAVVKEAIEKFCGKGDKCQLSSCGILYIIRERPVVKP